MSEDKKWRADDVKRAIAHRHASDMFFTEVKDGPTQIVNHHSRIDALAIKLSWTNFAIIGYEVKVARSDFLRDEKWRAYLPMCNQLYFAAAPGVCDPSEVPECCGLVTVTQSGNLRTVRKAPWRDIEPPVEMFKYLMFTYIGPYFPKDKRLPRGERLLPSENAEFFKRYLEGKEDLQAVGRRAGRKIGKEIEDLRLENRRLKACLDDQKTAQKELGDIYRALGVSPSSWTASSQAMKAIEQIKTGGVTPAILNTVRNIAAQAETVKKYLEGGAINE